MPIYVAKIQAMWANHFKQMKWVTQSYRRMPTRCEFQRLVMFQSMTVANNKDGYKWWIEGVAWASRSTWYCADHTSWLWILHWEIPAAPDTAAPGKWVKGPGYKLLPQWKKNSVIWTSSQKTLASWRTKSLSCERTGFPAWRFFNLPSILMMKVSTAPSLSAK